MKNKIILAVLIPIIYIGIHSCNFKQDEVKVVNLGGESNYTLIADTIINDVVIKNPNNDEWTNYCLRNLDKATLVNQIFKAVYNDELTPYEFFDNQPLTIDDIKALEKDPEFCRDKIAKVQFEEAWYYDQENRKMVKKVHSIMLAYEVYNSEEEIKGYKPAFKVYFNN